MSLPKKKKRKPVQRMRKVDRIELFPNAGQAFLSEEAMEGWLRAKREAEKVAPISWDSVGGSHPDTSPAEEAREALLDFIHSPTRI